MTLWRGSIRGCAPTPSRCRRRQRRRPLGLGSVRVSSRPEATSLSASFRAKGCWVCVGGSLPLHESCVSEGAQGNSGASTLPLTRSDVSKKDSQIRSFGFFASHRGSTQNSFYSSDLYCAHGSLTWIEPGESSRRSSGSVSMAGVRGGWGGSVGAQKCLKAGSLVALHAVGAFLL